MTLTHTLRLSSTLAVLAFLAACQSTTAGLGGGGLGAGVSSAGGGASGAGVPVTLARSGSDSCGAADHKFLEGQPFAHTFDLNLPANTRFLGRRQSADATNAGRMTMVVSTASPGMAAFTANAKILRVYCG